MQVARESPKPPAEHEQLSSALRNRSHLFATGDEDIQHAALAAAKSLFDSAIRQENQGFTRIQQFVQSLAGDMARQPRETRAQAILRQQESLPEPPSTHPQMQGLLDAANKLAPTPLSSLHVEGMEAEQIWNQLELRTKGICELVDLVFEGEYPKDDEGDDQEENEEDEEEDEEDGDFMLEDDEETDEIMLEDEPEESSQGSDLGEHIAPLNGEPEPKTKLPLALLQTWVSQQLSAPSPSKPTQQPKKNKGKGNRHPTLDDDFFSIAEFNREIEGAEAKKTSRGRLSGKDEDSDDEGSLDLFKVMGDGMGEDDEEEESDDDDRTLMYGDFFDAPAGAPMPHPPTLESPMALHATTRTEKEKSPSPPPKPSKVRFHEEVKVKLIKSKRNPLSLLAMEEDDDSEEEEGISPFGDDWEDDDDEEQDEDEEAEGIQNDDDDDDEEEDEDENEEGESTPDEDAEEAFDTMERAKDDLFADSSPPPTDLSTHAQRQLALKEQISQLEAENIAGKDWTMMGEANSRSRPLNSLLEEDLDFEHRNRVAKVITEEKVAEVEDLIKKRIVEGRFDDVVRRRAFDTKPFLPSKTFELQDTKSQQSLAQIYEDDYTAAKANGDGGVALDDRDGKLEKEHKELEAIWEGIADKLDALCNAHFTPKKAKGVISTVSNVASTTLESALPTSQSARSLLAPEEVFHSSSVTGVIAASKEEMTPREKQAVRMKKKRVRVKLRKGLESGVDKYAKMGGRKVGGSNKADGGKESNGKGKKGREKAEKKEALKSVVKTGKGVTVVGKGSGKK